MSFFSVGPARCPEWPIMLVSGQVRKQEDIEGGIRIKIHMSRISSQGFTKTINPSHKFTHITSNFIT
jgi:hypothetical protein